MIQAFGLTSNPRKALPPAVDDVSFEARAGCVTVLLGAPGAGKTTVLRLMLELQQGRGLTYFRGRPLHRVAHPAREVGVLLGDVPGHPSRTVRGHLRMLCAATGVPVRRADEVLEVVGLVSLRDERLGTLSRGMDRRLGLACALLADPHTLLLDTPANGLSVRENRWLHGMLRAHADQGGTVLTTTADPKEAARTADRVVTLAEGRLVADQEVADFARTRLRPRVAVRSPHAVRLAALLTKEARTAQCSVEVVQEDGNRLSVYGSTCAHVGEAAFRHGILIHQLADETGDMGAGGAVADAMVEREAHGPSGGEPVRDGTDASGDLEADEGQERFPASPEGDESDSSEGALPALPVGPGEVGGLLMADPTTAGSRGDSEIPLTDLDFTSTDSVFDAGAASAISSATATRWLSEDAPGSDAEPHHEAEPEQCDAELEPGAETVPCVDPEAGPEPYEEAEPESDADTWLDPEIEPDPANTPIEAAAAAVTTSAITPTTTTAPTDPWSPEELGTTDGPIDIADTTDFAAWLTDRPAPDPVSAAVSEAESVHPSQTPPATPSPTTPTPEPPAVASTPKQSPRPPAPGPLDAQSALPPPIAVRSAPSPLRPLRYELRRATGISTGFVTGGAVLIVSALTAVLLARIGHTPQARLLAAWPAELPLPPAALGAGLLGALAFGDEFRHPALAVDRGTVPRRLGMLTAKLLVAAFTALMLAFLTVGCNAEVLYLLYGREFAKVPADWLPLSASWLGLMVGSAWAGVLAAGVFRSTTAGLAAVVAVPVAVVPLVQEAAVNTSVRTAVGFPLRLREVLLVQWPFGGERYLSAAARLIAQPVGWALALSLTTLLCAYLFTTLRSRVR